MTFGRVRTRVSDGDLLGVSRMPAMNCIGPRSPARAASAPGHQALPRAILGGGSICSMRQRRRSAREASDVLGRTGVPRAEPARPAARIGEVERGTYFRVSTCPGEKGTSRNRAVAVGRARSSDGLPSAISGSGGVDARGPPCSSERTFKPVCSPKGWPLVTAAPGRPYKASSGA